jgi:thioredoxin-related protein
MDRRIVYGLGAAAVLISVVWGGTGWAKPRLIRRMSGSQAVQAPAATLHWQPNLRTAHQTARMTGRPMLVVFGGERCAYCKKLEAETLGNPALANYINGSFLPVHLDYQKDNRAAQVLEIKALPTCIILSPEADLLGTVEGFVGAPDFAKALVQALDFQRSLQAEDEGLSR